MAALSHAFVLSLAVSCQPPGANIPPELIAAQAQRESGLDPAAVHRDANGTTDYGLMQINSRNIGWLGLIHPFDACESIRAAAKLIALLSRYNSGLPNRSLGYASNVISTMRDASSAVAPNIPAPINPALQVEASLSDRPADNVEIHNGE